MRISLRITVCLTTVAVGLSLPMAEIKGGPVNTNSWNDFKPAVVQATEEYARLQCHYSESQVGRDKFLCKGDDPVNCEELIHTSEQDRDAGDGRFSIRDNKRLKYFYVHIKHVSTADSGTYWCGTDRTRQHSEYTKIHLSVGGAVTAGVTCLTLAAVASVALIVYRHKLSCRQGRSSEQSTNTEGNDGDRAYEEIQVWSQQAMSGEAPLTIYATVGPHTDQLLCTSVTL